MGVRLVMRFREDGLTDASNQEISAEPSAGFVQFYALECGDDEEEDNEYYGSRKRGEIFPQIVVSFVGLKDRHFEVCDFC